MANLEDLREDGDIDTLIPSGWWQVVGLKDDQWFGLHQAATEEEGRAQLSLVMRQMDTPIYSKYEDFRLLEPGKKWKVKHDSAYIPTHVRAAAPASVSSGKPLRSRAKRSR